MGSISIIVYIIFILALILESAITFIITRFNKNSGKFINKLIFGLIYLLFDFTIFLVFLLKFDYINGIDLGGVVFFMTLPMVFSSYGIIWILNNWKHSIFVKIFINLLCSVVMLSFVSLTEQVSNEISINYTINSDHIEELYNDYKYLDQRIHGLSENVEELRYEVNNSSIFDYLF